MLQLIITLLLEHFRVLSSPLLYLSLFFKRHRNEYYRRLSAVRTDGDWEGWIAFFLEAVATIAEEATTAARDIFGVVNRDRRRVLEAKPSTVTAARLFEELPEHPIVTIGKVTNLLTTTKPTATKAVMVLVDAGFKVVTAGDGEEALEKIRAEKPDFISLDLVMPRKSGHRLLKELRRDRELSRIPVLIVTAHARDELGKGDLKDLEMDAPDVEPSGDLDDDHSE